MAVGPFEAISWPGRVVFGPGALDRVPEEAERLGLERVLVIHGGSGRAAADRLVDALGSAHAGTTTEVGEHVPARLAAQAVARAHDVSADGLVTIGGGSATGLGKAVALETHLPVLAVPTTYAGSEMTPIFGITPDGPGAGKRTGRDPAVLPRTVVYDPELTLGLPPAVSAVSGMNAVAQAVEALWAAPEEPVTGLLAREAIAVLAAALPRVVDAPTDLDARSDALYGAFLAGTCLARSATGLHHRLCHALGGGYGLPHAATHAVVLPRVAAFNAEAAPRTAATIATALGADDPAMGLHHLNVRLGNPTSLEVLGLPAEAVAEVAATVAATSTTLRPRPAGADDLHALLTAAFTGAPPATTTGADDATDRSGARATGR